MMYFNLLLFFSNMIKIQTNLNISRNMVISKIVKKTDLCLCLFQTIALSFSSEYFPRFGNGILNQIKCENPEQ